MMNAPFVWDDNCHIALNELRQGLTITPILVLPQLDKLITMLIDASLLGLGDILMQERQVVVYASEALGELLCT